MISSQSRKNSNEKREQIILVWVVFSSLGVVIEYRETALLIFTNHKMKANMAVLYFH